MKALVNDFKKICPHSNRPSDFDIDCDCVSMEGLEEAVPPVHVKTTTGGSSMWQPKVVHGNPRRLPPTGQDLMATTARACHQYHRTNNGDWSCLTTPFVCLLLCPSHRLACFAESTQIPAPDGLRSPLAIHILTRIKRLTTLFASCRNSLLTY